MPFELPGDIAVGVDDVSRRGDVERPLHPKTTPCPLRLGGRS